MTTLEKAYVPMGAALELFKRKDREVLLSGPAGTGKSYACLLKLHMMALKNPGMRGLITRKTAVSLGSTALVTWRERVAAEALRAGIVEWYGGSTEEAAGYRYTNGSVINVGGMDKPTRIMSSEYDIAYVQEAIELTLTDWESITSRLRNGVVSFQQLIADTNPDTATHWLKARAERGATVMLESRHEDNPVLYGADGALTDRGAEYIAKLDALTGVRYMRLRKGLWVAAEGMVYEDYDPARHVVQELEIPEEWPRYWSVDFGYTNPFVLQCWAQDPDGRLYLYREIYRTKRLVEDHAKDILRAVTETTGGTREDDELDPLTAVAAGRRRWTEPRPLAIICDHDAEDRATLEKHLGMRTQPAKKAVQSGIQAVQSRLKVPADGRPRLVIVHGAVLERDAELLKDHKPTCTEEEVPGYIWPPNAPGRNVTEQKEAPLKRDDHGMDALRYLVAHRDRRRVANPDHVWL